jgi:PAS domain S-box-containing protein
MLWSATPEGNIDYCNTRLLEYSGLTAETVMNGGWVNLLHPDDREPTAKIWMRCIATGEPYTVEVRHFRIADQTYRWILTTALPLRDDDGRIIKWYGSCVEIHDRKQAEEALKASERHLAQIIDTIPAYVWSAASDGSADFYNRHYLEYLGVSSEEVKGWNWTSIVHPADLETHVRTWKAALASGGSCETQTRLRGSDGTYRWFLNRASALVNADGTSKWFGITIDIEGMKRAEEALRASERNLRGLTEAIPQMIWRTGPDGLVDYGNSRFLEYTGYTAEEIMGTGWIQILHRDDRERTKRVWAHAVATGEPYHIEYRVRRASDNSFRWCLVTALPLRDEDGTIMNWHGCCIDVHDWKLAQDELRATQAELAHATRVTTMGQLTASIAHELNQPLAGIMTNAGTGLRMLNGDPPNVQGAMETVRRTMRDAQRASDVITRLRALFSRRPTTSEIVDINAATREVIALSSNELQRKGVQLRADLDQNLPLLMGDRVQLQQVILNLVLNGAEAMEGLKDRSGELVISTLLEPAGTIRVSVRDCGTGLKESAIEKLFDPFFTTKNSGMGIGLSVSRTIVENHKGRLWAENNDGPGATFCFSVPSTATGAHV